jgi:hypothetical protein
MPRLRRQRTEQTCPIHHGLTEGRLQRVERAEEVSALAIDHVDEHQARQVELGCALP